MKINNHLGLPLITRSLSLLILCLLFYVAITLGHKLQSIEQALQWIGVYDFQLHWSSVQLFLQGANPYDSSQNLALQKLQETPLHNPNGFVNPPWFLIIMAPVYAWSFELSRAAWIVINILLFVASATLTAKTFAKNECQRDAYVWGTLLFAPFIEVILLGQGSVLLLFAFSVLLWASRCWVNYLSSMSLLLLTLKPHLFFMVFSYSAYSRAKMKKWKVFTLSAAFLLVLASICYGFRPSIFTDWMNAVSGYDIWRTPTLSTLLRDFWQVSFLHLPNGSMALTPLLGLAVFSLGVLGSQMMQTGEILLFALLISICFAPYAWLYDFVLLAPVQGYLVGRLSYGESKRWAQLLVCSILFLCQVACLSLRLFDTGLFVFWWYPWGILIAFICGQLVISQHKENF